MDTTSIIEFLKANPGSIAQEIGTTPVVMGEMEKVGLVERVGKRSTGKRGRPPIEWVVAGEVVQVEEAPATDLIGITLDEEEQRKLNYIDAQLRGDRFEKDMDAWKREDHKMLVATRKDILRKARNRATRPQPVIESPELAEAA